MDNKVQEELDLLREIFPDEFKVNFNLNQYVVTFVVTPGIGFNNPPSKLIKFNLIMMFTLKYPTESPTISIECVHGLKEKDISNLLSYLKELISERKGDPVLFDLVDFCREFISSNIPTVECAICLNYFRNEADVYCTTNFHYFHNYCIGEYVNRKRIEYEREVSELNTKCPYTESPPLELLCPLCHAESLSFSEDLINVTRSKENTESCDSSK
ncbi:E3 ubiquitin-protein ligase RNF25 [Schistosoma japonicum]|uniref:E3 ubiquitin-protein ligase RNF25 n=1 Tax=Schistosoma japonicum TaxID=6182 RepID=Q5DGN4_SCHJA|nr:SJCHGC02173 protein [Schistosoma japonicum]KAH8870138.1 E3 ubiquitin-protein ligase [Schistosoma japonicum]TNN09783.1 E3 ubiquitin-protein ligase RNF25 [Schistosoma japonicum]